MEGGVGGEGQRRVGWGEKGSGGWDGGRRIMEFLIKNTKLKQDFHVYSRSATGLFLKGQ